MTFLWTCVQVVIKTNKENKNLIFNKCFVCSKPFISCGIECGILIYSTTISASVSYINKGNTLTILQQNNTCFRQKEIAVWWLSLPETWCWSGDSLVVFLSPFFRVFGCHWRSHNYIKSIMSNIQSNCILFFVFFVLFKGISQTPVQVYMNAG